MDLRHRSTSSWRLTVPAALGFCGASLALPGAAQDVDQLPDESHVTLTGTVATSSEGQFTLDYGDDLITVEMDDWGAADDARWIDPGDRVQVDGRVDDGFYEGRTIEASRVFSYDRSTYYYANPVDEEGDTFDHGAVSHHPSLGDVKLGSWISLSGTVREIDDREFVLRAGTATLTVDTGDLGYNPLDNVGDQQIDIGDRVTVSGRLEDDLFDERELEAVRVYSTVPR